VLRASAVGACVAVLAFAANTSAGGTSTFVQRAEHVCVSAQARIAALPSFPFRNFDALHPDEKTLVKVGRFFTGPGNEVPIARTLVRQLVALGTPPSNQRAWNDVLATFREFIAVIQREATTALHRDVKGWVSAVNENRLLPDRLSAAAKAFGARRCAIFH
jgi:hypothetical protein